MSVTLSQAGRLVQHRTRVLDRDRQDVGVLAQVYVDEDGHHPLWAAVVFDRPSSVETVVPLDDALVDEGALVTSHPRALIETGPHITAGDELPWVDEERLRHHYGRDADAAAIVPIDEVDVG